MTESWEERRAAKNRPLGRIKPHPDLEAIVRDYLIYGSAYMVTDSDGVIHHVPADPNDESGPPPPKK